MKALACSFVMAALLLLTSPLLFGQDENLTDTGQFTVETVDPFVASQRGGGKPPKFTGPIPHVTGFDPATFAAQQEAALTRPGAQAPDSIVDVASGPGVTAAAFAGASFLGLDRAAAGGLSPPDTTVGQNGMHVIEVVNSAIRMFSTSGFESQTKSLQDFFGAVGTEGIVFDPRIHFDRTATSPRYYVVAAQSTFSASIPRHGYIWLAVSRSSDPPDLQPSSWCFYKISGVRDADDPDPANDSWADFPSLGVGQDTVVISANQATFASFPSFTYAVVRAISKTALSSCGTINVVVQQPGTVPNDLNTYTLMPVQHYTNPRSFPSNNIINPVYLVSTRVGTAGEQNNTYRVWRLSNVVSGSPRLDVVTVVGDFFYALPPAAPQLGGVALRTNNERVRQAAGWSDATRDTLWAVHSTLCNVPGGSGLNESCARMVRFDVGAGAGGSLQASISQQTTFGRVDVFYWMPGIAVNNARQTVLPFQFSHSGRYLSAAWTLKNDADAQYPGAQPLTAGVCTLTPLNGSDTTYNSTGDYVGAQTSPDDFSRFWVGGERAAVINGKCQWQTQILEAIP